MSTAGRSELVQSWGRTNVPAASTAGAKTQRRNVRDKGQGEKECGVPRVQDHILLRT